MTLCVCSAGMPRWHILECTCRCNFRRHEIYSSIDKFFISSISSQFYREKQSFPWPLVNFIKLFCAFWILAPVVALSNVIKLKSNQLLFNCNTAILLFGQASTKLQYYFYSFCTSTLNSKNLFQRVRYRLETKV